MSKSLGHGLRDVPGRHTQRELQSVSDRLDNALAKLKAQEPVIEAAKAWAQTAGNGPPTGWPERDLYAAVEALQEQELSR